MSLYKRLQEVQGPSATPVPRAPAVAILCSTSSARRCTTTDRGARTGPLRQAANRR